jgi:hypothetical protein
VSSTFKHQVLLPIKTLTAVANGTLTIMTTSTNKLVRIDGLAISLI